MNIDPVWLVTVLATSALGFVYASYGKKMQIPRFLVFGVLLMGYGYLVSSLPWMIAVGVLLAAGPFLTARFF